MLGLFVQSVSAASLKDYPRLSANAAESPDFEIVKLIDGPIDALYQVNHQARFIAQADDDLWLIDGAGEVVDIYQSDALYTSGLILEEDGFVDWLLTGDKQKKAYETVIDVSGLDDWKLFELFNQAEIVEFIDKDEKGFAYLYQNGAIEILDISHQREKINNLVYQTYSIRRTYNLHWDDTEINSNQFDSYQKKPEPLLFINSAKSLPPYAHIDGYQKITYHKPYSTTEMILENILGPLFRDNYQFQRNGYPVGYSAVSLNFQQQQLKFSVLSDDEFDSGRHHNLLWLDPNQSDANGLKFMAVIYRRENLAELNEERLLPYYEQDVGLYVLRKKLRSNQFPVPAWQLSYSGLHSYELISGQINFKQESLKSAPYWFHQWRPIPVAAMDKKYYWKGRRADIVSPVVRALPSSVTFRWADYKPNRAVRLVVNGRDANFYDKDGSVVQLTLFFDQTEIAQAFTQLGHTSDLPIQLQLQMEERPWGAELIPSLQNAVKKIVLHKTRFDYKEQAYTPQSPDVRQDDQERGLFAAYEKSLLDFKAEYFVGAVQKLMDSKDAAHYAPSIGYYFSQLSVQFNINSVLGENAELMDFYFNNVHPILEINHADELLHKNLMVFASQVIFTGANLQNQALSDRALSAFVDHGFELQKETNRAFLYNLACYYSLKGDKPAMLSVIRRTMVLGRDPASYLTDTDFTRYWQDPDFREAIKPVGAAL